jgi:U32 family peptidase
MVRSDIEIMAPVGSYESLMAAIQGGAGSVYFGVEHLNMRSRSANNFTLDDLRKIVGISSANGVKTYLTLNVEIFDTEKDQMHAVLDAAKQPVFQQSLPPIFRLLCMHVPLIWRFIFQPR